ncbi:putative thiamine transporter SLC35F3 isoform X2 [Dermacentor silvarum]|uniref:putative thiamine transporter SLC35F3 isoform X2 n=1 Tax=Dermacentor silvarum TaxID=543639 RepID=UPI002100A819|nr:putative thiamine transporter SLC35F3 isoform X2 [Dermacentor silvarum]
MILCSCVTRSYSYAQCGACCECSIPRLRLAFSLFFLCCLRKQQRVDLLNSRPWLLSFLHAESGDVFPGISLPHVALLQFVIAREPADLNSHPDTSACRLHHTFRRRPCTAAIGAFLAARCRDGPADGVPPGTKADRRCCNENSRKVSLGLVMTLLIAASWVGAAHMLKATFAESNSPANQRLTREGRLNVTEVTFDAPFFTTWVCASFNTFFFPIFLMGRLCSRTEKTTAKNVLIETLAQLQEKQFTFSQFFSRCGLFCLLWVVTNYALVHSLRILDTTDVLALYASNVSFVYLLSWVILHEQFVGIRIVAVILCNTGIALLAYMDGVTRTMTLGGVVLAAAAAAGSGVYKVTFKKLIGDVTFGQLSLFFSLIGFLNLLLMWPVLLALYLLRFETIVWSRMPWGMLAGAGALSLLSNLLGNFGIVWTFEIFLTLGLAFAVPISAIVDVYIYEVMFEGMKLAGILLILIGFMLVLLPEDWPDYLTMILRYRRSSRRRRTVAKKPTPQDTGTGHRSRLRTPSGRIK